jgi:hypothetical protein
MVHDIAPGDRVGEDEKGGKGLRDAVKV